MWWERRMTNKKFSCGTIVRCCKARVLIGARRQGLQESVSNTFSPHWCQWVKKRHFLTMIREVLILTLATSLIFPAYDDRMVVHCLKSGCLGLVPNFLFRQSWTETTCFWVKLAKTGPSFKLRIAQKKVSQITQIGSPHCNALDFEMPSSGH